MRGKYGANGVAQVLGKPLGLADLESLDPEFFASLTWILENPINDAGLGAQRVLSLRVGR